MLRLPIKDLQPGLVVARNIYNASGNLLLSHDTILDEYLIIRLQSLDIESIYIKNPYTDCTDSQEVINETTRIKSIQIARKTFESFKILKRINVCEMGEAVKLIIDDILAHKNGLIHLTDIRTYDDYTYAHSVNTCVLALLLGLKMGLTMPSLYELGLGVILHDIGKMLVPLEILHKKERLTADEWEMIQEHALSGFTILKKAISLPAAHVAYQHHENYNGTGYPRGLGKKEIHLYARIAAVVDLYDAITSDRPYRAAMPPNEAYEVILGCYGIKLDPDITSIFLENLSLYPVGTLVLLDTQEVGVVIDVHPKLQARPVVQIILDKNKRRVYDKFIDLSKELTRFIVRVLEPKEIIGLQQSI